MKSIRSRILSFAVLATVVPSVGLGALSFWRYQRLIADNVETELRTQSNYVRSEAMVWLRDRVREVRTLATANTLVEGSLAPAARPGGRVAPERGASGIGPEALGYYLRSVQSRIDTLLELTLFDVDGRVLASSADAPTPAPPTPWRHSPDGDDDVVMGLPRWDPARATPTVTVLVPVHSPNDARLGSLAAVVDLGRLRPRLARAVEGASADTLLLAPGGKPLLDTRGTGNELVPIDDGVLKSLHTRPDALIHYVGHRGRAVVGLAQPAETLPLIVVSERERDDVYREWLRLLALFSTFAAGLALLVGAIAYWMGRSIVRPLDGLMAAADRIGAGDLDVHQHVTDESEIGRLTRAFNAMAGKLRESRAQADVATEALQRQNTLLERLAITDSLTGLHNRKRLNDILAEQFARFRRTQRPVHVVMLDIDHFKALNDTYGHLVGDRVLAHVASLVRSAVRDVDAVARYGGEEFAVVLEEATTEGALETAERIRSTVAHTPATLAEGRIPATVSVGVSASRYEDRRPEDVVGRADAALYKAKHAGRNRVERLF